MPQTLFAVGLALVGFAFVNNTSQADDTAAFFNGKDLTGWEGLEQYWTDQETQRTSSARPATDKISRNTFLCSKARLTRDFELTFKSPPQKGRRQQRRADSQRVIADKEKLTLAKARKAGVAKGYWGSLYGELIRRHDEGSRQKRRLKKVLKPDDFNDYSVKVVGKHCTITLNGLTTVDQDFDKMPADGIIAWQLHQGYVMEVTFKDIKFTDLSKVNNKH